MAQRPRLLLAAACCLLLLTSCGGELEQDAEQKAYALRETYTAMAGCEGTASMTADYGQRVYEYQMDFAWNREQGLTMTLLKPEIVAGVTARATEETSQLEFEGVMLETGPLGEDGLSPIAAIPQILTDMQEQYIAECCETMLDETPALQVTCRDPEAAAGTGRETVLWLDPESGALLQGELYEEGACVIFCQFDRFAFDG